MTTTRRSVLALAGAAPLAAGGVAALAGSAHAASPRAASASDAGSIPRDLRPGGAFDQFVGDLAARDEFSGSVLVTYRGRTVLARSHGMANKELAVPNGPDTIFILGSITKLFTAVAIAQLAQRGKVAYQATLGTYVEGFPAEIADKVTVHQLLTHTSGLGNFFRDPDYWRDHGTWGSEEEVMNGVLALIRRAPLEFTPGAGQAYSNSAFVVLGAIVAAASGQTYYDYVREHVFRAAGMTGAGFFTAPQWRDDRRIARPYGIPQGATERVDVHEEHGFVGTPAGGSFASCPDLDRFARALAGAELVNPAHTQLLLSPKVPLPGGVPGRLAAFEMYGAMAFLMGDRWVISRNGGASGVSTDMQMFPPDDDWVTVVLTNYDEAARAVTTKVREIITS
ncbi:serine hydrolase domain-containing protein [Streptomyces litchfieldiae]|uniref:Serine hydrolase domain-containing protein n=1 Tax=Streptomyces litchfieldiae TaxID=3075543 RepID=A0ABU2MPX4_9ACTN|nr:serine hydrolase domain-containing protein [Streptomyces sp. DSM 44938]MDT0342684.1 serine hydrolase domain-containing protein [Streptomyces sp. DSM 44938]